MKKRAVTLILFILFAFFSMLNILLFLYSNSYSYPMQFTGRGIIGTISLIIEGLTNTVSISSPENITYNFNKTENYSINLNVSSNFDASSWRYVLTDLRHDIAYTEVFFTPNISFNAVRWSNKIIVYANDSSNNVYNSNVVFFISVPNSAPLIGDIDSQIYECETKYLAYFFNATDIDEDDLTPGISPRVPFYIDWPSRINETTLRFEIFSGTLSKSHAGGINGGSKNYSETISVSDGQYSDSRNITITVIEINNVSLISTIGVQTVWTKGENSSFYKQVQVSDTESGNQDSGNLTFNITFLSGSVLFNISSTGIMNFTPNSSQIGIYNISICVNDSGIQNPHPNISLCGQTGGSLKTCQNFSLTITSENRKPTITSYYPLEISSNISGTDALYFNITKYDADGTVPDAYWYVDNVLKQYNSGSLTDSFSYSFGCGVSGSHQVKAEITDGLANDSITWSFNVANVVCPVSDVSGGGGGGGIGCVWKWGCNDWSVCQNTEKSLKLGIISGEDYRSINKQCEKNKWLADFCGFQIRKCIDLHNCSMVLNKPAEIESCFYVETPSCNDGVKNCHDDACEFLVDCGGPCPPCSTCSDKKQNQGEEGIDCGGPCPFKCEIEKPMPREISKLFIILIIGLILLAALIIIAIQIRRIYRHVRKLRE